MSGGYIVEALFDLTGAPTECIHLNGILAIHDHDELWARMMSFSDAGFLMGLATSGGGEGLVSCHAYSVLEVLEVHDSVVGEQPKLTSFFQTAKRQKLSPESQVHKESKDEEDDDVIFVDGPDARPGPCSRVKGERETIRLVRIRNPWGKKEWTGGWSASSEKWTRSLRSKLDGKSYAKGDGTFFMSFQDMLQRFSTLDIAKCHEGWVHKSYENIFIKSNGTCGRNISESSSGVFFARVVERTWAFISIVQPKKRANTQTQYWYSDASLILLKRPIHTGDQEWVSHAIILHGVRRTCTCEVFLDPLFEYCIIPFSVLPHVMGNPEAKNVSRTGMHSDTIGHSFRLTTYSSNEISIHEKMSKAVSGVAFPTIKCLHRELITSDKKILYVLGPQCILLATQGSGCIYFMVLNATHDKRLLVKLTVASGSKGALVAFGNTDDTHDLGPRMQRIVLVLMNNGREGHSMNELGFSYASDFVPAPVPVNSRKLPSNAILLGDPMELSMAGDVLAAGVDTGGVARMGKGTIDSCLWSSSTV
uniref:Calpain catalytic domain-containing protein n=1 Tax=Attheya septentrionalis TaxID=420275 RepID=A0A7S2UK82_9STRA